MKTLLRTAKERVRKCGYEAVLGVRTAIAALLGKESNRERTENALHRCELAAEHNLHSLQNSGQNLAAIQAELAGVCFNYANFLAGQDSFEIALNHYRRAAELSDTPIFHHYHGNLLDRIGRFQEAEAAWEKAVSKDTPESSSIFSDVAMRLVFHGDRDQARRWLERALENWKSKFQEAAAGGDFRRFLLEDYTSVIGHMCLIDYYLKARQLGWFDARIEPVIIAEPGRVVNPCLLDYWKDHIAVIDSPGEIASLREIARRQQDGIGFTVIRSQAKHYWEAWAVVQEEWEKQNRPPLLAISDEHRNRGYAVLKDACGLEADQWFVCLHVREPGFHGDETGLYQTTRNANIETYKEMAAEVTRRGGKVIRLGDASMRPFSEADTFDYARSPVKSDWMDVFLCAASRLFIGTASGLAHLPPVFGVPCALTNWCPAGMRSSYGADRFITKLIWSRRENRLLTFREMMNAPVHHWQYRRYYDQADLELRDNDASDITALVCEMLDDRSKPLSEPQLRFEAIARTEPICYGISPIGRHFVEKHLNLLNG